MMVWVAIGAVALSFGISLLATPLSRQVAQRFGMMDVPARHKTHGRAVPLLGGSAIFAAILGPSLLAISLARIWAAQGVPDWLPGSGFIAEHVIGAASRAMMGLGILAGAFVLHVVGIIDDRKAMGPVLKLTAQLAVCSAVVALCDLRILTVAGGFASFVATVLWLVTIINAFNFLDNMDGLAAGVAAICAAALLASAASIGQVFVPALLCLIIGALLGFLPYNFPPARTFMGDAGSLVIGYLLGVATCLTTYVQKGQTYYAYGIFVPLVLMAVPLYDMVSVIWLRVRDRRNPMVGDRRHFSHRLIRRGMSVRTALLTIYLCTAATSIGASLLTRVGSTGAILIFVQTVLILLVIALLEWGDVKP